MFGGFFGGFGGSFNSNMNMNPGGPCGCGCGGPGCCGGSCCCETGTSQATPAALRVPIIFYEHEDETPEDYVVSGEKAFILVEHPQHCMRYGTPNLADHDKGAQRYYSGRHGGTAVIYFRHDNWVAQPCDEFDENDEIYYGIYFFNKNAADAHVTILRQGASYGWMCNNETFKQYLSAQKAQVLTLPPNGGKWLFLGRNDCWHDEPPAKGPACFIARRDLALPVAKYAAFDGALKFATDYPVHVQLEAFADFNSIRGTHLQPLPLCLQPGHAHTTGVSPGTVGELRGEFTWSFDDHEPVADPAGRRYLEVELPERDGHRPRTRAWTTHTTGRATEINPVKEDILPYEVVVGTDPLKLSRRNAETWPEHLANWGVVYREKLTFVNNGCETRQVDYQFRVTSGHFITVQSAAGLWDYYYNEHDRDHPRDKRPCAPPRSRNFAAAEDNIITVVAVVVPPKERRTIELAYVVSGQATGAVEHRLRVLDVKEAE